MELSSFRLHVYHRIKGFSTSDGKEMTGEPPSAISEARNPNHRRRRVSVALDETVAGQHLARHGFGDLVIILKLALISREEFGRQFAG
jgi:hypothetical protein